jgi:hypothetical protein
MRRVALAIVGLVAIGIFRSDASDALYKDRAIAALVLALPKLEDGLRYATLGRLPC